MGRKAVPVLDTAERVESLAILALRSAAAEAGSALHQGEVPIKAGRRGRGVG